MRNIKALLSCAVLAISMVSAQEAGEYNSHESAAKELLEVMHAGRTMELTVEKTLDAQVAQNPELAEYKDVIRSFFSTYMNFESIEADMIQLYTDSFSEDDLKGLINFYATDLGQRSIDKLPHLGQRGAEMSLRRLTDNMDKLQEMLGVSDVDSEQAE